ncbi:hypothetical protein N480_10235 [Pseudoalteromonas luteoviolacea S2607]|uniref:hypothetical protein n=1 Tax=Pseudoalteromonas luteoviolacea TaxID=43657 RepID=UPI0007B074F5|nr:hypothetical protein [Pseudoalteromonas luteoviolacea]KZN28463.1 hypothetical protein N480_10235 [Pseudoalteromonas luteoviolacea S2607]
MKLAGSILLSSAIVFTVWGVALLQPTPARAISVTTPAKASEQPKSTTDKVRAKPQSKTNQNDTKQLETLMIEGNTATLATAQVEQLWRELSNNKRLNQKLLRNPSAIYVYYRDFSANYDSATITVGYSSTDLSQAKTATTIASATYDSLLEKKKYTPSQLSSAWQEIDYRRNLERVIEIHYLSENSEVLATEVLVKYKEL